MFTRKEYLQANAADGAAAHRRYYGEIAREAGIVNSAHVSHAIAVGKITLGTVARDGALNNVRSLGWWDRIAYGVQSSRITAALKARGDFVSLGNLVCLVKEAVRLRLEGDTAGTLGWYRPEPLAPDVAWARAADWGSFISAGDPGACFYGFGSDFHVQSEAHRRACLRYADRCIATAREPLNDCDRVVERARLRQLKRALRRAQVAA